MKKARLILGTAFMLVMAMGVAAVAVGCDDPQSAPETYTLTYEKGAEETGTAPEAKSYESGQTVTLAPANTFGKEGCTFTKWLDGTAEYDAGATFTMPERNVTLKAKWQENKPQPEPSSDKMVLGENVYTLGADDADPDDDTLGRVITFQGKPDTNYTFEMELKGLGSLLSVYDSKETYDAWGEPLLSGDTLSMVLTTDGGGTLSLYLNNGTYDAESYDADTNTVTITVTEGANVRYAVAFYNKEEAVGSPADFFFEITWGKSFNQEYADDGTNKFPVAPEEDGYEFIGWFDEEGVEFTADTVVKSKKILVAKYEETGTTDPSATKLVLGKNNITLTGNDVKEVDGWDVWGRAVEFSGDPNAMYTFTLTGESSNFAVYGSQEDCIEDDSRENALINFFDDEVTFVVLRADSNGKINLYLFGDDYYEDGDEVSAAIKVEKGGIITYPVIFYRDENSLDMQHDRIFVEENTAIGNQLPAAPQISGLEFLGWFEAIQQGWMVEFGEEVTAETVVTEKIRVVGKWISVNSDPASQELILGKNNITLTKNDVKNVDGWNILGRTVTLNGANPNGVYTFTLVGISSNLRVYSSQEIYLENEDDYLLGFDGFETLAIRADSEGKIKLYLAGGVYAEEDLSFALMIEQGGTITYTVSFQTGNRPYLVTVEEGGTVAENEFYTAPELSGKRFIGWFIVVDGEMTEEFTSDTVVNSNLELVPQYEDTETTVNTLTADELTNSLASYPDFVKKGETLTITGEAELTDVTANGNGIFVVLSKGGSAYVMPAYNNWVYGSQDGQHENAALNFVISTAEYGFTDSVSGGVWDNFNAMILKKTCAVK